MRASSSGAMRLWGGLLVLSCFALGQMLLLGNHDSTVSEGLEPERGKGQGQGGVKGVIGIIQGVRFMKKFLLIEGASFGGLIQRILFRSCIFFG